MTDQEILNELGTESLLNRVRRSVFAAANRIEQAQSQRKPLNVFEVRRMEFEAARAVIDLIRSES